MTAPETAGESIRSVWNYNDALLRPKGIWSSLGSLHLHPLSEKQQISTVPFMLFPSSSFHWVSLSHLLLMKAVTLALDLRIKLPMMRFLPLQAGISWEGTKSTDNPRAEDNVSPLRFPLSLGLWFYCLLSIQPSFSADQHFYLQPKFSFNTGVP